MKKVLILCAVLFAFTTNSFAQAAAATAAPVAEKKEGMAGQKRESWKNLLGLTAEQDAKMKEISKANKEKSDALKNDATLDKDQKKTKLADLRRAYDADLKAILTADQLTKYTDIQKQRKEEAKAKQGEKAPEKQ
jgi:Spy/CpxP family protein refolding chaperone